MSTSTKENLRLFLSYAFEKDTNNVIDLIREIAEEIGFEVVTGHPPDSTPPANFIRRMILGSDCFLALLTPGKIKGQMSSWVSSEIGIAYGANLPLFICIDERVEDIGLPKYIVSYLSLNDDNHRKFKTELKKGLEKFFKDVNQERPSSISAFIHRLLNEATAGRIPEMATDQKYFDEYANFLAAVVKEYGLQNRDFRESDSFAKRRELQLGVKQTLAKFIVDILEEKSDFDVFMDSGTTTYTICEELVNRPLRVSVITNNLASGRQVARIPQYPLVILPGRLDTNYVASLGPVTEQFAISRLKDSPDNIISIVAATSFTATKGPCGHDHDHRALKRAILTNSNDSIIIFAGEKLLEERGEPVFGNASEWQSHMKSRMNSDQRLQILTHYPENWNQLSAFQKKLFRSEVDILRTSIGQGNVYVLGSDS